VTVFYRCDHVQKKNYKNVLGYGCKNKERKASTKLKAIGNLALLVAEEKKSFGS
jgi:hypothetical protein